MIETSSTKKQEVLASSIILSEKTPDSSLLGSPDEHKPFLLTYDSQAMDLRDDLRAIIYPYSIIDILI